jgi:thymidine kinase
MNPTVELVVGPMFSGKSTELLRRMKRMRAAKQSWLLLVPKSDSRYFGDDEVLGTHDHVSFPARKLADLSEVTPQELASVAAVIVDEGQFFPGLAQHVRRWLQLGKNVVVAALNGTSELTPFPEVSLLYPLATHISLLNAICTGCHINDAPYSKCLRQKQGDVLVGDSDVYRAQCARCFGLLQ